MISRGRGGTTRLVWWVGSAGGKGTAGRGRRARKTRVGQAGHEEDGGAEHEEDNEARVTLSHRVRVRRVMH